MATGGVRADLLFCRAGWWGPLPQHIVRGNPAPFCFTKGHRRARGTDIMQSYIEQGSTVEWVGITIRVIAYGRAESASRGHGGGGPGYPE